MNKVCLAGHLGVDPKLIDLPSGTPAVEFTVATDESYKDREGNKVSRTEWHRIKIYGRAAEFTFSHIYKGSHVYIEGSLRTRSWDDKETGRKRYLTEVVVSGPRDCIQLLEKRAPKPAESAHSDDEHGPAFPSEASGSGMDDVPF
jgi:single-strand DNA-binding protein